MVVIVSQLAMQFDLISKNIKTIGMLSKQLGCSIFEASYTHKIEVQGIIFLHSQESKQDIWASNNIADYLWKHNLEASTHLVHHQAFVYLPSKKSETRFSTSSGVYFIHLTELRPPSSWPRNLPTNDRYAGRTFSEMEIFSSSLN
jgi:hypothetical protein